MSTWTSDELTRIENADELDLSSLRRDGAYRSPVTMWVVRIGLRAQAAGRPRRSACADDIPG